MEKYQPYSFKAKIPTPPFRGLGVDCGVDWGVSPYILNFKQPAGTSRGVYTTRKVWYITYHPFQWQGGEIIIGECAPLPGLSCDDVPEYETVLKETCKKLNLTGNIDWAALRPYPSILFGFEMAFQYLEMNSYKLWNTPFSQGEKGIPINGLIWMGDKKFMIKQIDQKMDDGFRCLKLKIGSLDFEEELQIIKYIREIYQVSCLEIRVDANGAFTPEEAQDKLERLAELDVHSIEQPIRAGQWDEMAKLVESSSLPIALDEELIGMNDPAEKEKLFNHIRPQYIIINPPCMVDSPEDMNGSTKRVNGLHPGGLLQPSNQTSD